MSSLKGPGKKNIGHPAQQYSTMAELREGIDHLDRSLVDLLSIRQSYMAQAARIKQDRNLIRDEGRIEDVVSKVVIHAKKVGADPQLVEALYRQMIEWCICYEMDVFEQRGQGNQTV